MKITSVILNIFFCLNTCSYSKTESEPVDKNLKPNSALSSRDVKVNQIQKSKRLFPIIAYIGVDQKQTNLAAYREMAAAGINQSIFPFSDISSMDLALEMAKKTNVKLFIDCPELKKDPRGTAEHFKNNTAVAGYNVKDEPTVPEFKGLSAIIKTIRLVDKKHLCYVNLYPNYAASKILGSNTYSDYLNKYLLYVPTNVLSFDHYPISGKTSASINGLWYENLEVVAAASKKAKLNFWAFVLSTSLDNFPAPTLAMMRLQAYSNLAYGAQGIQYFTYSTHPYATPGTFLNSPIDKRTFKKTDVYFAVKQLNKEIQDLSEVFLGAKMLNVSFTGDTPKGTHTLNHLPKPVKELTTNGIGAVVSLIQNHGNSYLVIVNRDFTSDMTLTINTVPGVNKISKLGVSSVQKSGIKKIIVSPGDIAIYSWADRLN